MLVGEGDVINDIALRVFRYFFQIGSSVYQRIWHAKRASGTFAIWISRCYQRPKVLNDSSANRYQVQQSPVVRESYGCCNWIVAGE